MSTTTPSAPPSIAVPEGYTLHSENSAHILLPNDNGAFLNPVQEFNRDLSVACIRIWGEQMNEDRKRKWEIGQERKARKSQDKPKKQRSTYTCFVLRVCIERTMIDLLCGQRLKEVLNLPP